MTWVVHMPVSLCGCREELVLHERSGEWERIRPEYRDGRTVRIPADQFCDAAAVPDKAFVYRDGKLVDADGTPAPGGTVVLLESPHKSEYSYDPFTPLEPLRGSRWMLERHLPAVIAAARERKQIGAVGDGVTLCNPVQVQCSLHRLAEGKGGILGQVRNATWRALFGLAPVRAGFLERLAACRPALIINGCTKELQSEVATALAKAGYGPITVAADHPSSWVYGKAAARVR